MPIDHTLVLTLFESLLLVVTVLLTLALAIIGWLRWPRPGARYFGFMLLAAGFWALCELGELLAADVTSAQRWSQVSYLGIVSVPVLWFAFAMDYSGRWESLPRSLRLSLLVIPALTLLLVFTNPAHGWVWSQVSVVTEPRLDLQYAYGAWFWVNTVYAYTLLLMGALMLVVSVVRAPLIYRQQVWVVVTGAVFPWIGNLVYLNGATLLPGVDTTPVAFGLTGLVYTLGLWRARIFDLAPIARDAVVEGMDDGVLLVDARRLLLDANPAAVTLLNLPQPLPVGQSIQDAAPVLAGFPERFAPNGVRPVEVALEGHEPRFMEVRCTRLQPAQNEHGGWLVLLRDVTAIRAAEKMLATSEESYRTLVENSGVPMILTSLENGRLILANQRAYEYIQIAEEELLGRLSVEFYRDPDRRVALLEALDRDGRVDNFNLDLETREGRKIWLLISARRIYYQGEPAILSFFQDITTQRERMERLEAARQEADFAREMAEVNARQLQKALVAVEALATTDDLTGALNRRRFSELMGHELSVVRRYRRPAALIMFDLDGFKQINDHFGHQAGDAVLRHLSELLMENLRGSDYLVRWGGDEFVILAPEIPLDQAELLAEKIRQLIAADDFPVAGRMTASLGVTEMRPDDDLDSVVLRVDRALYDAKEKGGNRIASA